MIGGHRLQGRWPSGVRLARSAMCRLPHAMHHTLLLMMLAALAGCASRLPPIAQDPERGLHEIVVDGRPGLYLKHRDEGLSILVAIDPPADGWQDTERRAAWTDGLLDGFYGNSCIAKLGGIDADYARGFECGSVLIGRIRSPGGSQPGEQGATHP